MGPVAADFDHRIRPIAGIFNPELRFDRIIYDDVHARNTVCDEFPFPKKRSRSIDRCGEDASDSAECHAACGGVFSVRRVCVLSEPSSQSVVR